MKAFKFMIFLVASSLLIGGCSKDDNGGLGDFLIGTVWVHMNGSTGDYSAIKFVDSEHLLVYTANSYGMVTGYDKDFDDCTYWIDQEQNIVNVKKNGGQTFAQFKLSGTPPTVLNYNSVEYFLQQ